MTQYQATQQLHKAVQAKAKELGLKPVDLYNFNIFEKDGTYLIEEPQIKQILIAFQEKLGEDPTYTRVYKMEMNFLKFSKMSEANKIEEVTGKINPFNFGFSSKAETLYQRFCCGFPQSEFEINPVAVLTELNEIIKNLK
jgi:hypothetical protein